MLTAPDFSVVEYQVALEATRRGSQELLSRFVTKVSVQTKWVANFASEADLAAEEVIMKTIREQFPEHTILAEESNLPVADDAEHLWLLIHWTGPIISAWHSSLCGPIAYYNRRKPVVGIVYNPISNELYSAIQGEGGMEGTARQHVPHAQRLDEVVMACGFYYDRGLMKRTTPIRLVICLVQTFMGCVVLEPRIGLMHVGCGLFRFVL